MNNKLKTFVLIVLTVFFVLLSSCRKGAEKLITKKIMYDVMIVNDIIGDRSISNPDWFWENLPAPEGDKFIEELLNDVINGKRDIAYFDPLGSYDNFDVISIADCADFINKSMLYTYNEVDTIANPRQIAERQLKLNAQNIKYLRFLEEWHTVDNKFHKRVIAIAPIFLIQTSTMDKPFKQIHFWILMN
jgi:hypothetical protein